MVSRLDSYRDEIVIRTAEYLLRQGRRMGRGGELAELWPAELRELAHERGWRPGRWPGAGELAEQRDALRDRRRRDPHPVLGRLAEQLGLGDAAICLLAACAVAQLDPSILRLWQLLRPSPASPSFPLGTWLELLDDRAELYRALDPDAPLRRLRLLEVRPAGPSLLTAEVEVPGRVVAALLGQGGTEPALPAGAVTAEPALAGDALVLPAAVREGARPLARRTAFIGAAGAGRCSRARWLARAGWRETVIIDPSFAAEHEVAQVIALGLREAALRDALPIVRLDAVRPSERAALAALAILDRHETPLAVAAPPALVGALLERLAGLEVIDIEPLPLACQRQLWASELAARRADAATVGALPERIVASYDMLPRDIAQVARRLPGGGAIELSAVQEAVRAATATELWGLASRISTSLTWADAVLPETTMDLVRELLAHASHRATVFEDWGYARKVSYGRALTALFYGPPGTGKTMAASLIAADLGRDLFRVDLSRIVDKYVGETEKNLERIFRQAVRSHAMLLFDEADSLFAKRTGVESANDRYANMAVNYLLQALEAFDGVCILTTNMDSSIDEAFRRRMRFRIEFPQPSVAEQAALWRGMITPQAKVAPDLPWEELAEEFPEMSGAHIRSAVLRAAFLAVAEGGIIDLPRIRRAARAEYEELGHIVTRSGARSSTTRRSTL